MLAHDPTAALPSDMQLDGAGGPALVPSLWLYLLFLFSPVLFFPPTLENVTAASSAARLLARYSGSYKVGSSTHATFFLKLLQNQAQTTAF